MRADWRTAAKERAGGRPTSGLPWKKECGFTVSPRLIQAVVKPERAERGPMPWQAGTIHEAGNTIHLGEWLLQDYNQSVRSTAYPIKRELKNSVAQDPLRPEASLVIWSKAMSES
eukprot:2740976-Amphidinium_carterae.1